MSNNTATPMCVITGLEKDTNYVFMCRAMNDRGFWSDWSAVSEAVKTKEGEAAGGGGKGEGEGGLSGATS